MARIEPDAAVVELADTHDSKSCGETRVGSTPTGGTNVLYADVPT